MLFLYALVVLFSAGKSLFIVRVWIEIAKSGPRDVAKQILRQ